MADDKSAIEQQLNYFIAAVNKMDVDLFMDVWDENGVQMGPGAPANVGKNNIRKAMADSFELFTWTMKLGEIGEIEVDGKLGFMRCSYSATLTPKSGGDSIHVDGKDLSIWKKQAGGDWKLYRDCFNSNV